MGMGVGEQPTTQFRSCSERPCYKLSAELLKTYKGINELFYAQRRKKQEQKALTSGLDDEQGNYIVNVGDDIGGRYIVQEALGKGSFGVVVKALDQKRDECVAVKVIKNKAQFFQQAKVEIDILTKLNTHASEEHNIVKLKKVFTWREHLCLVFELLSFNLYDLLKYTKFSGISLNLVRKFAFQILKTLEFLSSSAVGIVHCDLKPENILLKNPKRSSIKVIDFGSSCYVTKKMFKYIQSRFYRAPEVILGLSYDCAIDMWSLGCILVEMHTGQPVFDGKDEAEQLIKMVNILGPLSQRMAEQSPKRKNFFQMDLKQKRWMLHPPTRDPSRYPATSLEDILGVTAGGPGGRRKGQAGHTEADYLQFVDFVRQMFNYTPGLRLTPALALQHPFLAPVISELATPSSHASPSISRVPSAPSYTPSRDPRDASASGRLADNDVRALSAQYGIMEGKWQPSARDPAPSQGLAGSPASAPGDAAPKADRRLSLLAAAQATASYRMTDLFPPPAPPESCPRPQSGTQVTHPTPGSVYLPRTHSVPHVASSGGMTPGRKVVASPARGVPDSCRYDTPNRPRDFQANNTFGSPTSPSANFAHGSLRLKPKQPGGTGQVEPLAALQSPSSVVSARTARALSYIASPAARHVLYAESPNSGKYGLGTPSTPRTGAGQELRQYLSGPVGSPLPAADGRKWLPSPMLADLGRKLNPDSPCSIDGTRPDVDRPETRGYWPTAPWPDSGYGTVRLPVSLHHGGAEPMGHPFDRS